MCVKYQQHRYDQKQALSYLRMRVQVVSYMYSADWRLAQFGPENTTAFQNIHEYAVSYNTLHFPHLAFTTFLRPCL